MSKHTPGPWKAYERPGLHTEIEAQGGHDEFDGVKLVAKVLLEDEEDSSPPLYVRDRQERDANARLIAAAPDLLNALQALQLECLADPLNPCWDNRPTDVAGKHWGVGNACTSCNARAAIARALGQESKQS